ncbi:hypothetical protein D3C80_1116200 [compost metagenome]
MNREASVVGGLQQGKPAEGYGRFARAGQVGPGLHEPIVVRAHIAVEEQQAGASRRGRQPVAPDGAALVAGQGDQADRQGAGVDPGDQPGGQGRVAGAVVQQDCLGGAVQPIGFTVEERDQGVGIIAQEGDKHRQGRAGGAPRRVVVNGGGHAAAFRAWMARNSR